MQPGSCGGSNAPKRWRARRGKQSARKNREKSNSAGISSASNAHVERVHHAGAARGGGGVAQDAALRVSRVDKRQQPSAEPTT